jgi:hypothetical protein
MSPIIATILPFIFQIAAACFQQKIAPTGKTQKQYLVENKNPDGSFPQSFLDEHRGMTVQGVRRSNHGKRPHDRIKLRDVNIDEATTTAFQRVIDTPDHAVETGYAMALNMSTPVDFNASDEANDE